MRQPDDYTEDGAAYYAYQQEIEKKDARILELESMLKGSLGLTCNYPARMLGDYKWHEVMCESAKKQTLYVMDRMGLNGSLDEYSCAVNVLSDIVDNANKY